MTGSVKSFSKFHVGDQVHTVAGYYHRGRVVGQSQIVVDGQPVNSYDIEYLTTVSYPRTDMVDWLDRCLHQQKSKLSASEYEKAITFFDKAVRRRVNIVEYALGQI